MPRWITRPSGAAPALALLFLLHATCYLYFFVDDEGITLVYARSLLDGLGLTYAPSEGPVEGYSNFLHVFVMAGLLGLVRVAGLGPAWAFVFGGLWALSCGIALVVLTWRVGERLGIPPTARAVAGVLLALAGPLAVWSNSSLETVPFALAFFAMIAATVPAVRRPRVVAAWAITVCLLRVDGPLYAAAWLLPRAVFGDAGERRRIAGGVVPVVLAAGAAYTAWRVWYFGSPIPLPLQTKVAHKLIPHAALVTWTDEAGYLLPFARHAGLPLLLGMAAVVPALSRRNGRRNDQRQVACSLALMLAGLLVYVGVVGDWMFGFRFMVALLAPLALLLGLGLADLERHRPTSARLAAAALVLWAAGSAWRFQAHYRAVHGKPVFWAAPSLDPARLFGEYYEILEALAPRVRPGALVAYHEAGFVPFMLDVENIDMLGLTTRAVGRVPTRDAVFTDVGRYYPFTPEPAHHSVHAYLVHRQPSVVVVRKSWMRTANRGRVPDEILDGHYRLATVTPTFTIYERAERAIDARRASASGWLENLAHPAYLRRVSVNGKPVAVQLAGAALPSLWQGPGHEVTADPLWALHLDPEETAPVLEIYLAADSPSQDTRVEVTLRSPAGAALRRLDTVARAGESLRLSETLEKAGGVDTIDIRFSSLTGGPVRIHLNAVRVMGQGQALRAHLRREGIPGAALGGPAEAGPDD